MGELKTRKLQHSTMVVRSEISAVAGDMMMNRCKKHPKHKQSSGVCSFCLRERLSQLLVISSSSKNRKHNNKITTALSSYSSSISSTSLYSSDDDDDDEDDSTCDSPIYSHVRGGRMSSMSSMKVPVSYLIKGSSTKNDVGVFTRSRSVAVVPKNWIEESNNGLKTKKKKGGFWSKLLWSSSNKNSNKKNIKKEVVLMHSRTVREMPINSFL